MTNAVKWAVADNEEALGARGWPAIDRAILNDSGDHLFRIEDDVVRGVPLSLLLDGVTENAQIVDLYKARVNHPAKVEALEQASIVGQIFRGDKTYRSNEADMRRSSGDLESTIYFNTLRDKTSEYANALVEELTEHFEKICTSLYGSEIEAPARAYG